ncbi:C40 family peptidase [Streptomyces albidoflavus]
MTRHLVRPWMPALAALLLLGTTVMVAGAIAGHNASVAQAAAWEQQQKRRCVPAGGDETAVTAEQVRALLDNTDADIDVPGLPLPEEQVPIAQAVIATGAQMGISAHGQVVALATALQESNLRNLPYGDRDSLGVFQQRPSMGWGTPAQILDPVYASQKFYEGLQKIDGWEEMPVTEAAQAVQRSAYPDAYAKHEPLATALQQAIGPTLGTSPTAAFGGRPCAGQTAVGPAADPQGKLPDGYTIPRGTTPQARAAIEWALQQLGGAYQWGGSCTNPRGAEPRDRCDCSSLMQRAYGVAGVSLSRTTYTQVNEGKAVPAGAVRAGDLVFSGGGNPASPQHVALALGDGLVVHAPAPGKVIEVTSITSNGDILAVRRIA